MPTQNQVRHIGSVTRVGVSTNGKMKFSPHGVNPSKDELYSQFSKEGENLEGENLEKKFMQAEIQAEEEQMHPLSESSSNGRFVN